MFFRLNVLAHRLQGGGLQVSGQSLFAGSPDIKSVRTGYVMQEDILEPTLTVRETLRYGAHLRLAGMQPAARDALVEEVILELGLKDCASTRIGSSTSKGCSGGMRLH